MTDIKILQERNVVTINGITIAPADQSLPFLNH